MKRERDQLPVTPERRQFDAAFIRAIDRQAEMVAHTPGWKPLIDLVWEELQGVTRSESAATIAPPTEDEIAAYRNLFRSELDKRMDTKHPSASPSTESHAIALRAFVEARNAKARRFAAPDLSAPENVMRGRD